VIASERDLCPAALTGEAGFFKGESDDRKIADVL